MTTLAIQPKETTKRRQFPSKQNAMPAVNTSEPKKYRTFTVSGFKNFPNYEDTDTLLVSQVDAADFTAARKAHIIVTLSGTDQRFITDCKNGCIEASYLNPLYPEPVQIPIADIIALYKVESINGRSIDYNMGPVLTEWLSEGIDFPEIKNFITKFRRLPESIEEVKYADRLYSVLYPEKPDKGDLKITMDVVNLFAGVYGWENLEYDNVQSVYIGKFKSALAYAKYDFSAFAENHLDTNNYGIIKPFIKVDYNKYMRKIFRKGFVIKNGHVMITESTAISTPDQIEARKIARTELQAQDAKATRPVQTSAKIHFKNGYCLNLETHLPKDIIEEKYKLGHFCFTEKDSDCQQVDRIEFIS